MHRFSIPVVAFASVFLTLGTHSGSAQTGLDSMLRQLGERAIEEIVRPDPPQVLAPAPTTPRPEAPTALAAPKRAEIREVQQLLDQLGYDPGLPDGLMGPNTARAISAFQRDAGTQQTGTVTDALIARLRAATPSPSDGRGTATPQRAQGPSFNCARASTPTERAICVSDDLSELDRAVARNYAAALEVRDSAGRAQLQSEQRAWLADRDRCGSDVMCLVYALGARSQTLIRSASAGGSGSPTTGAHETSAGTRTAETATPNLPSFPISTDGNGRQVAPIFLAYNESVVPRELESRETVQRQRYTLASIVFGQVSGTALEEQFLNHRALTESEILDALRAAGIERTPFVDAYLRNSQSRNIELTPEMLLETVFTTDLNQFEKGRLKTELQERARRSLMSRFGDDSLEVTLICGIRVLDYNFDAGRFPFDAKGVDRCFAGRPNSIGTVSSYEASLAISGSLRPEGLPIAPAEAEALVDMLGGPQFVLAVPARITGRVQTQDNGRPLLAFTAEPTGSMEIRAGAELMEVLHRFSLGELQDATDTPEARKLADFDREWWLDTPEETSFILGRATTVPLEELEVGDIFRVSSGLNLAIRLRYPEAPAGPGLTLADFLDQRNDREREEIAASLGLPVQNVHLVQISPNRNGGLDRVILILPQPVQSFEITGDLPAYQPEDGDYPGAHLRVAVTAETRVVLAGGQERLVLAGHPDRLVVRRSSSRLGYKNSPEITSLAFSRRELGAFDSVRLAWKSDLVLSAAEILGVDANQILSDQIDASSFAKNDAFARADAVTALSREARVRTGGQNRHWMQARVGLSAYDFDRSGWEVQSLSSSLSPEASEADRALRVELMASGETRRVFLPMAPDEARAFQNASSTFPNFDGLVSFRVDRIDTTYGNDFARTLTLVFEPVEMILFDAGQGQTVIDESTVRHKHTFSSPAPDEVLAAVGSTGEVTSAIDELTMAGAFPILGVKIGADFDFSVEELAQRLDAVRRLYARTEARQKQLEQSGGQAINDWDPYHNAVLLEATGSRDMVAVYYEPPGAASTVTAISRTKLFDPGAGPSWQALRDTIVNSYPDVDLSSLEELEQPTSIVLWNRPERRPGAPVDAMAEACVRSVNGAVAQFGVKIDLDRKARANDFLRPFDSQATWVDGDGAPTVPSFASPPSMPMLFGGRENCPPVEVLVVLLSYGSDGRVTEYRQVVAMPEQVASIARRRQSDAAEAAPTIDLDL